MEPNRIGRALGIGARVAGAKLREQADRLGSPEAQEAAARAKAAAAQAARNFRAAQASAGGAQAAAGSASSGVGMAEAASSGTRRLARGAGRFGSAFFRPFAHASSQLWNEITGIFFALFAVFFIEHTWMVYRAARWGDRHIFLYGGLALVFVWFAASTFWRVRRRKRRG